MRYCGLSCGVRTRIGYANSNISAIERLLVEVQCLLEALNILKLNVCKALGTLKLAVLDDTNTDDITASEEFRDSILRGVVGQISKVCREGRPGRKFRGARRFLTRVA
jgi:hypothetical protein